MKLTEVHVRLFRNILDSTPVTIQEDVTCLVGKNESGKTSFLKALHLLNPAISEKLRVPAQYPAWLEKKHRLEGEVPEEVVAVTGTFVLTYEERERLRAAFGTPGAAVEKFSMGRSYEDDVVVEVDFDVPGWVKEFMQRQSMEGDASTLQELAALIDTGVATAPQDGAEDQRPWFQALKQALVKEAGKDLDIEDKVQDWLFDEAPKFLYFDNYSSLPGVLDANRIAQAKYEDLEPEEQTAKALLELAHTDQKVAVGGDYERRKRELENTANALTGEILDYWSQNTDIRVEMDFNQRHVANNPPVVHELHVRLYDNAHMLSLPFDERSTGFRWFFSFLCAFSRYRVLKAPVIILLDEPALGLHATAQRDFLKYIDEKLVKKAQVIYTTHSPFLVNPDHLERVRLVEDKGKKQGAVVSADVMSTDKDTLFPLQGALGYDLAQNLLVGPNNLIVEGTSDYVYLRVMSTHLKGLGRVGLDDRWTIVPVGGADQVATFVALLGQHVDATVLLDSHPRGNQRLDRVVQQGIFERSRIIGIGDVTGAVEADIEDLFNPGEYVELYNVAFGTTVKVGDLNGTDPIVKRLARHAGVDRFDHGQPAEVLLRDQAARLPKMADSTKTRFEDLFKRINATIAN